MTTNTNLPDDVNSILQCTRKGNNELHKVACSKILKNLKKQLKNHAHLLNEKNADGDTPFLYACKLDQTDDFSICEALIKAQVDICATNNRGANALVIAAARGALKLVEMLLSTTVSIRLIREGIVEAIKAAKTFKSFKVIKPLLEADGASDYICDLESDLKSIVQMLKHSKVQQEEELCNYIINDFGIDCDLSGEKDLSLVKEASDYSPRLSI